jgi:NADPH:quinone reductase-like Zn-dependent oxidoreductase
MKAVVRSEQGSFEVRDVTIPIPQERQVLVRMHATSVNDFDFFIMHPPLPFRLIGRVMRALSKVPQSVRIGGCDVAGTVEAVGRNVMRFHPGDAVFGDLSRNGFGGFGAFAEYVCASEDALLPKPGRITFEQAAALPQAGVLAMQGLLAGGPIQPGWKILINGGGRGVGSAASFLNEQTGNLKLAQRFLGHADISTTVTSTRTRRASLNARRP